MAQPFLAFIVPVSGGAEPPDRPTPAPPPNYPGYWVPGGNYPSGQPLPPGGPVDPGYGRPDWGGGRPDAGLPPFPGRPDAGLPPFPGRPDAGLPPFPGRPDAGLPPFPGRPDAGLPWAPARPGQPIYIPDPPAATKPPPDSIWPPLVPPGSVAAGAKILVWVVGVGYRWIHGEVPSHELPPTAEPKPA